MGLTKGSRVRIYCTLKIMKDKGLLVDDYILPSADEVRCVLARAITGRMPALIASSH